MARTLHAHALLRRTSNATKTSKRPEEKKTMISKHFFFTKPTCKKPTCKKPKLIVSQQRRRNNRCIQIWADLRATPAKPQKLLFFAEEKSFPVHRIAETRQTRHLAKRSWFPPPQTLLQETAPMTRCRRLPYPFGETLVM